MTVEEPLPSDEGDEPEAEAPRSLGDGERAERAPSTRASGSPTPWLIAGAVTLGSGAGVFQAFRPENSGQPAMLLSLGLVYGLLTALTAWWLHRRGELKEKLAPRRGDITLGAIVALGMYLAATGVHLFLTARGSPKEAWLIRVYLQIGDPQVTANIVIGPIILAIAAAEEAVWRGLVLGALRDRLSARAALIATTALYTAAHAPTLYLVRDPYVGLNPLVVMAALGCGLVWGWLATRLERVSLSMVAHALFTWSVVEFPIMNM